MDIPLPRDLQPSLVRRQVEAGAYELASEMVVEALYLLAARDRLLAGEQEALRREIDLGIEQCDRGEVVEADEVFARLRERMGQVKAPAKSAACASRAGPRTISTASPTTSRNAIRRRPSVGSIGSRARCRLLAEQPRLGRRRDGLRRDPRSLAVGNYLTSYRRT